MKNKKASTNQVRQGDVLLRRIAAKTKTRRVSNTVALGEATGHHHTFDSGAVCFADDDAGQLAEEVEVSSSAVLSHQEHGPVTFPAGTYERLYQVEDTSQEIRPVED